MMGEYSICVSDGKVIGDSAFYIFANDALGAECKRLCDFCDATDKNPSEKKAERQNTNVRNTAMPPCR